MITLTENTLAKIKSDRELKMKLAIVLKCSERMVDNYIRDNSRRFTELDSVNVLVDYTGMPLSDLVTGGKLSKLMSR